MHFDETMATHGTTERPPVEAIQSDGAATVSSALDHAAYVQDVSVVDTIIISDLHLGAKVARARQVLETLARYSFRRLILNGDVFDDLNFKRLKADDWKFLSYVRKMSHPRHNVDVVWVIGNHDGGVADVLSHLLGVAVHEEYVFEVAGQKHLAIHGHQFDRWVRNRVVITAIATALYTMLQAVDRKRRVSRWVKRTSKKLLRMGDAVGTAATKHGKHRHDVDCVHCGHTHIPHESIINGIRYINSGSWTDSPSQYVTITVDGVVTIHHV